jgi:DNA-binding CsgD family transcriptional regulator
MMTRDEEALAGAQLSGQFFDKVSAEIARMLDITEGTVKVHLKNLMRKISAGNRTQAALWARNHGIGDDLDTADATRGANGTAGKALLASPR